MIKNIDSFFIFTSYVQLIKKKLFKQEALAGWKQKNDLPWMTILIEGTFINISKYFNEISIHKKYVENIIPSNNGNYLNSLFDLFVQYVTIFYIILEEKVFQLFEINNTFVFTFYVRIFFRFSYPKSRFWKIVFSIDIFAVTAT